VKGQGGTIDGIQVLRAIAALMVVVFHARFSVPGGEGWPIFGFAGVDIFFHQRFRDGVHDAADA
jgi:peptidoglycan/LPS O-acetylase OafA/YrhL